MAIDVDQATWDLLDRMLDEALDLDSDARDEWLDNLPTEHEPLRERLVELLAHADGGDRFEALPQLTKGSAARRRSHPPGSIVGPYRIIRHIGDGGMGAVFLAERADALLQRQVALKLTHAARSRPDLAQRMAREREILASLDHANIARLYDAGINDDGQPYLALEYIDGRPIDVYVREESLDLRSRLLMFVEVCRAVAHAHGRLVLHRDIKPSNILVTAGGSPQLLDFGIAKLLDDGAAQETELTQASGRALTISYASPEQVRGVPLSVASDVYSLGVLLYELLTEAPVYRPTRRTIGALEDAVLDQEPLRPSEVASPDVARQLRGDLDTVLLEALHKDAAQRYPSVDAFREDIERYLAGYTILARPATAIHRVRKFVRRNVGAVALVTASVLFILSASSVAIWQWRVAVEQAAQSEEVKEFIVSLLQETNPWTAKGGLRSSDLVAHAREQIDKRFDGRPRLRAELLGHIGTSTFQSGEYETAEALFEDAIDEAKRSIGPDDLLTLDLRRRLLNVYYLLERNDRMKAEIEDLLPYYRNDPSLPQEHRVLALQLYAMATIRTEEFETAQRVSREGLELALELDDEHQGAAVSLATTLALALQDGRHHEEAIAAAKRAVEIGEAQFNGPHARVSDARSIYGRALASAGYTDDAVRELERVVRDATAMVGPDHLLIGVVLSVLAPLYVQTGEVERSIESAERAVAILMAKKDPQSVRVAQARLARATALLAGRREADALPDLDAATEILEKDRGPSDDRTRKASALKCVALARLGRTDEARGHFRSLDVVRSTDGTFDELAYDLGVLSRLLEQPKEALRYQDIARASLTNAREAKYAKPRVEIERGLALLDLGRIDEAESTLATALEEARAVQKGTTPEQVEASAGLARARASKR